MRNTLKLGLATFFAVVLSNVVASCGSDVQPKKANAPQLDTARAFAAAHGMNNDTILLCDFRVHSGKYRFFVYSGDSIVLQGLCAHGCGGGSTEDAPIFSNTPGSNASSLGFYRVGAFYTTVNYGLPSYRLHGLDSTNDNAYRRMILIHPWGSIKKEEVYPEYTSMYNSQGCFVINEYVFKRLRYYIDHSSKPLLLYAYY